MEISCLKEFCFPNHPSLLPMWTLLCYDNVTLPLCSRQTFAQTIGSVGTVMLVTKFPVRWLSVTSLGQIKIRSLPSLSGICWHLRCLCTALPIWHQAQLISLVVWRGSKGLGMLQTWIVQQCPIPPCSQSFQTFSWLSRHAKRRETWWTFEERLSRAASSGHSMRKDCPKVCAIILTCRIHHFFKCGKRLKGLNVFGRVWKPNLHWAYPFNTP